MERNIFREISTGFLRKLGAPIEATSVPTTSECPTPPRPHRDRAVDAELIEILEAARRHDETIAVAFQRKELALADVFARLDLADARAMHARLVSPQSDDRLAECFFRLAIERRLRLLDFLGAAPRRRAIGGGR